MDPDVDSDRVRSPETPLARIKNPFGHHACSWRSSSLSLLSTARFGSGLAVLDVLHLGSALSLRSFARVGSCLSVNGLARFGSVSAAETTLAGVSLNPDFHMLARAFCSRQRTSYRGL